MSVRKSVKTPVHSRFFLVMSSVLVMVAGMLFGANIAAADSVQVQSYQRASQTATCDSPPESMTEWRASWANPSDPISGPTWHPTWERWANNGNGGWTCTRSITWARSATSARSYSVGDIGPGGGLVFYIDSGSGLRYEMAPKVWGPADAVDPASPWCSNTSSLLSGTFGTVVGTGEANTALMVAVGACTSGAANSATAYRGGGFTDWFLPSMDELNAMCYYSRNLSASPDPTVSCYGGSGTSQNGTFASGAYGFASDYYWSSSQFNPLGAFFQYFADGYQYLALKTNLYRIRPVRAF